MLIFCLISSIQNRTADKFFFNMPIHPSGAGGSRYIKLAIQAITSSVISRCALFLENVLTTDGIIIIRATVNAIPSQPRSGYNTPAAVNGDNQLINPNGGKEVVTNAASMPLALPANTQGAERKIDVPIQAKIPIIV